MKGYLSLSEGCGGCSDKKRLGSTTSPGCNVIPRCPAGGADSPGSQVFPVHASRPRDPQTDPGEESEREGVRLLREERSLRLPADVTGGVFGQ